MANNFPAIRSSMNLDFVNGIYVDSRITFTRAGTRTYFGREVVKAEENLFLQSATFTNAAWSVLRTTIVSDVLTETTDNNTHVIQNTTPIGNVTGLAYTQTWRVKKGAGVDAPDVVQLTFAGGSHGTGQYANFDISAGTITDSTGGTAAIAAVGSGVFDISWTATATATGAGMLGILAFCQNNPTATRTPSYAGQVTADVQVIRAQLEQRSSATAYTATTTQPITRYQRQLKTAAANEWPREFDPVTGECLGRSVWEARTNLLLRSEEFDNAAWVKTRSSITANQIIAPDGTVTADLLVPDTSNNSHFIGQAASFISGSTYTLSAVAYAAGYDHIRLAFGSESFPATGRCASFNVSSGAVGETQSGVTAQIQSLGGSYYRCSITAVATSTGVSNVFINSQNVDSAASATFIGDGVSGARIWGAQLEAGAFASPYTKTVAAQVTRLADSAVMTGVNFSSWFNPEQGTLVVDATPFANGAPMQIDDGTLNNRIFATVRTTTGSGGAVVTNGSIQADMGSFSTTGDQRASMSYKTNDFKATINGAAVATDTVGIVPVVDRARFFNNTSTQVSGYIRRITYYPQALTAANLQAVTR
jgi:hypothetical protein